MFLSASESQVLTTAEHGNILFRDWTSFGDSAKKNYLIGKVANGHKISCSEPSFFSEYYDQSQQLVILSRVHVAASCLVLEAEPWRALRRRRAST